MTFAKSAKISKKELLSVQLNCNYYNDILFISRLYVDFEGGSFVIVFVFCASIVQVVVVLNGLGRVMLHYLMSL